MYKALRGMKDILPEKVRARKDKMGLRTYSKSSPPIPPGIPPAPPIPPGPPDLEAMTSSILRIMMAASAAELMAWVLTLPVCVFLGAALFALGLNLLAGFGLK